MKNYTKKIVSIIILSCVFLSCISSVTAIITVPDPPTNLDVIISSGSSGYNHDLTWEAPADDGGAAILGYKIEYADFRDYSGIDDMQSSYWNVLDATKDTQTSYTYEGTSFDNVFCFRVSAYNSEGTGLPSNYKGTCWNVQADVPDRIFDLEADEVSDTQIDLSWNASDDNGLPIIGYKIEYRMINNLEVFVAVNNTGTQDTKYSHTGLLAETYYEYKVYAINAMGISDVSHDWEGETTLSNLPGPPKNVMVSFGYIVDHEMSELNLKVAMNISWEAPEYEGGSPITGYKIEYFSEGVHTAWSIVIEDTNTVNTTYVDNNTVCGADYLYRVSAINSYGVGESTSASLSVKAAPYDDNDCDGVINVADNCPEYPNPLQKDTDADGAGDKCDNCELTYNPDQADGDGDGIGNICDDDPGSYDTPGFELVFVIIGIFLIAIWKKKK